MRPLHFQGRLPRTGLRLLDIFVKQTSAYFTPEYRLVGVVERPLGPRHRICQVLGAGMGAPVTGARRVALCRARTAQMAAVVPCRARGGSAGGAPAGLAKAGVETPLSPVGVGPSSSLPEPASRPSWLVGPGGRMVLRLLSRHRNPPLVVPPVLSRGISSDVSLCRGHPDWGASETLACPRVARFLTGRQKLLLVFCWEGSGRRGCGGRWRDGTTCEEAIQADMLLWCPCCK